MASNIARKVILGIDVSQFRKGITQVDSQMKGLSRQMSNLGGLIGATFVASIVGDFVMETIQLNSELKKAEAGFKRVGSSADLSRLRTATRGLVSDVTLMQKTTQAANFGIPVERLAMLFEFAQRRAAETGESVDYLVNSMVVGLGRKSIKIIDNLGISATALKEEMGGVAVATAGIADVTAAVSRIAERELGKMGDATVTAADEVKKLQTEWGNLKAAAGGPLASIGLFLIESAKSAISLTSSFGISTQAVKDYGDAYLKVMMDAAAAQKAADTAAGPKAKPIETLSSLREQLKALKEEWESVDIGTKSFTDLAESVRVAEERLDILVNGPLKITAEVAVVAARDVNNLSIAFEQLGDRIKRSLPEPIMMFEDFTNKLEAAKMVGQQFGDILSEAFTVSVATGENFFDILSRSLKAYMAEMLAAIAATMALAAVMSAMTGGSMTFGASFKAISAGSQVGDWMNIVTLLRGKDIVVAGSSRAGTALNRSGVVY